MEIEPFDGFCCIVGCHVTAKEFSPSVMLNSARHIVELLMCMFACAEIQVLIGFFQFLFCFVLNWWGNQQANPVGSSAMHGVPLHWSS